MRRRAPARADEDAAYAELRHELLPGRCDVCAPLAAAAAEMDAEEGTTTTLPRCTGTATELHHLRKRSSSGALAERDNVRRSCHDGNQAVERHPRQAERAGLVIREGHPDWDRFSSRTWRKNR